jgi:hypothetical protein
MRNGNGSAAVICESCGQEYFAPRPCAQCGQIYEPQVEFQRFCSDRCRMHYWMEQDGAMAAPVIPDGFVRRI